MNEQEVFFGHLASLLSSSAIPFMVSGSLASSTLGKPRSTNDIDIVIDPTFESLNQFLDLIPKEWYVNRDAAHSALSSRSMFNVLDVVGEWKADLIVRKNRPFSRIEFARAVKAAILGIEVPTVTPEDSILSKLEWSRDSSSERQYSDALGVALVNSAALDKWGGELKIADVVERLLNDLSQKTSSI